MGAVTSPDSIAYPTSGDDPFPLETHFATLASSTQTALTNIKNGVTSGVIPRVANATARNAIFPSPIQGNAVYRLDLGYTERFYTAYNSSSNPGGKLKTGWQRDGGDSGWTAFSGKASGVGGDIEGRIVGNQAYIRGNITKSIPKTGAIIELLKTPRDPLWRPADNMWGTAYSAGYVGGALIRPNGTMAVVQRSAANWTGAQFSISYVTTA